MIEPSETIHQENHTGYPRTQFPLLPFLRDGHRSRRFLRTRGRNSGVVAGQGGRLFGRGRRHLAHHSRCLWLRTASASAASNLAGTGLRAPGRPLDRSLSSKRGRRRGAVRAHPLFRLRTHSPSASDPFAADAPGPPKHHVIPQGERRCRRIANRPRSGTLTACGHLGPDLGPPSSPDAITSWSPRIAPMI